MVLQPFVATIRDVTGNAGRTGPPSWSHLGSSYRCLQMFPLGGCQILPAIFWRAAIG